MGLLGASEPPGDPALTWPVGEGWLLTLEPDRPEVYPRYLADPRRPRMGVGLLFAGESQVPASGDSRFALELGARAPLVGLERTDGGRRWRLYAEAGFFGQFDRLNSLDEIGWDGWYALYAGVDLHGPWRARFGVRHLSAHLGDELVLRTGRQRIDYTREDAFVGVAWVMSPLTVYVDGGYAPERNLPTQRPLVAQAGAQFERWRAWGPVGWYAAVDGKAFEEDDFEPALAAELGLSLPLPGTGAVWRLAVEGYAGRAILGEFSRLEEDWVALSLGVDF
jgi:hypothetical protein